MFICFLHLFGFLSNEGSPYSVLTHISFTNIPLFTVSSWKCHHDVICIRVNQFPRMLCCFALLTFDKMFGTQLPILSSNWRVSSIVRYIHTHTHTHVLVMYWVLNDSQATTTTALWSWPARDLRQRDVAFKILNQANIYAYRTPQKSYKGNIWQHLYIIHTHTHKHICGLYNVWERVSSL